MPRPSAHLTSSAAPRRCRLAQRRRRLPPPSAAWLVAATIRSGAPAAALRSRIADSRRSASPAANSRRWLKPWASHMLSPAAMDAPRVCRFLSVAVAIAKDRRGGSQVDESRQVAAPVEPKLTQEADATPPSSPAAAAAGPAADDPSSDAQAVASRAPETEPVSPEAEPIVREADATQPPEEPGRRTGEADDASNEAGSQNWNDALAAASPPPSRRRRAP